MVEVNPAGWFQALATHTAEQMRSYLGSPFAVPQGAQSLKTASAVHPGLGTAMAVTQNGTPNMTVNVGAGSCWIAGTETTKQGTYFCQNDASKSLTIGASDPTLNRIDLIVAKVQDAAYSGSINAWSLVVVPGTAAGSPVAPAAPANSITLAQVTISANVTTITTGAISDQRPWNAALGGIVPATSTVRPANPYNGLYAHELDTFRTVRYNGTNWHQVGIHVCTAATRPAGPYVGMQIYETDTNLNWQWNGTRWFRDPLRVKATQTQWVNTTAQTAVTGMTIPVDANSVYEFSLLAMVFGLQNTGVTLALQLPTSATFDGQMIGWQDSNGALLVVNVNSGATPVQLQGAGLGWGYNGGGNRSSVTATGTITVGANAGNVVLVGAQRVANAGSASIVDPPSWMEIRKI